LSVPANPVFIVGTVNSGRIYAISQGANAVTAIQLGTNTILSTIPVGVNPVYGVMSLDNNRAFILNAGSTANITGFSITGNVATINAVNQLTPGTGVTLSGLTSGAFLNSPSPFTVLTASGSQFTIAFTHADVAFTPDAGLAQSGSVSVINTNTNQLDSPPALSTNPIPVGAGPIWADLYPAGNLLVTANSIGNNISIISIPLCSIVALPTNPSCTSTNPTDATTFGQVLATVPVGVDPTQVTVLQDGTRAYVANTNPAGVGSVSVVSLSTFTVTKTIPFDGLLNGDGSQNVNHGANCHPNFINSISGTPTGKVYVTCADSNVMTVLETDTDTVRTLINLQGRAVQMRVSGNQ
jgi:YVTN family beta-propeller protein